MEPYPGKVRTSATSCKFEKEINGNVMPDQVECAKRAFNTLVLLTKDCNVFFSPTLLFH